MTDNAKRTSQPVIQAQHMPGPWELDDENSVFSGKTCVAYVKSVGHAATTEANACLIAAAPELLEALTQTLQRLKDWRDGMYPMSDAAIANAEAVIAAATVFQITSAEAQPDDEAVVPEPFPSQSAHGG